MRRFMNIVESVSLDIADIARKLDKDLEGNGYETVISMIRMEHGQDPYDDTELLDEDSLVYDWCEEKVRAVATDLEWMFSKGGGKLKVWRKITAPKDWKIDSRHPGIYWSWDERAAEAHWGDHKNGNVVWVIEAVITENDVNWPYTIIQNALPDYSEECEIRLLPDQLVNVISCKIVG